MDVKMMDAMELGSTGMERANKEQEKTTPDGSKTRCNQLTVHLEEQNAGSPVVEGIPDDLHRGLQCTGRCHGVKQVVQVLNAEGERQQEAPLQQCDCKEG